VPDFFELPQASFANWLKNPEWWTPAAFKSFVPSHQGEPLAYYRGPGLPTPEFAYAAFEDGKAQRSLVFLRPPSASPAIVAFDWFGGQAINPVVEVDTSVWKHSLPFSLHAESQLQVFEAIRKDAQPALVAPVESLDLRGATLGSWTLLFHDGAVGARSALSFAVETPENGNYLVAGLSPGVWDVWRNGWLQDLDGTVRAGSALLFFPSRAGSFFLRRWS
jgi:hypothetical protein